MRCDLCGHIGAWMPQVRYGSLVLRLDRACYEKYLRALYPELLPANARVPIDLRMAWLG